MARDAKINRKDETVKKEPFEGENEVIHFWITNITSQVDTFSYYHYITYEASDRGRFFLVVL